MDLSSFNSPLLNLKGFETFPLPVFYDNTGL